MICTKKDQRNIAGFYEALRLLMGLEKPKRLPQKPPTIWANWEILLELKEFKNSLPRYRTRIRIKVRGISPSLKLVKDARSIIIKRTPLAPRRPVLKNIKLRTPVTRAVTAIIKKSEKDP